MPITPYIHFGGNCEEALTHYANVFGGEIEMLMRWSEGPPDVQVAPEHQNWVMHASLRIGESRLMASDSMPEHFVPPQGISVSIEIDGPDEARAAFDALKEGGQAWMEFGPTFWSSGFGMLTDRFGIQWMISLSESHDT
ncbi:VOC family protein [Antarctobacter jejuensis]|uniref:VOC family protein n=1 Tax=Antarctobacter jejuensis TaxID=1439938 RepID=UPI003FD2ABC5